MIAAVVVALDEGADVGLNIGRQIVVLNQDVVLQGLMPALDLALGLGMVGGRHGRDRYPGARASPRDRLRCRTSRCLRATEVCERPRPDCNPMPRGLV